jgi:hypothetical protein
MASNSSCKRFLTFLGWTAILVFSACSQLRAQNELVTDPSIEPLSVRVLVGTSFTVRVQYGDFLGIGFGTYPYSTLCRANTAEIGAGYYAFSLDGQVPPGMAIHGDTLTCGNSYAYSSTGTVSNATWTGTGIDPAMAGKLTETSITMTVEDTH